MRMSNHITDLVVPLHHARLNLNTAYPDQAKIADLCDAAAYKLKELEAEVKHTKELHAAILALIGSEGMTDAKFVQWVEKALAVDRPIFNGKDEFDD